MPEWPCREKILAIYCQNSDESIPPDRGMRALFGDKGAKKGRRTVFPGMGTHLCVRCGSFSPAALQQRTTNSLN